MKVGGRIEAQGRKGTRELKNKKKKKRDSLRGGKTAIQAQEERKVWWVRMDGNR